MIGFQNDINDERGFRKKCIWEFSLFSSFSLTSRFFQVTALMHSSFIEFHRIPQLNMLCLYSFHSLAASRNKDQPHFPQNIDVFAFKVIATLVSFDFQSILFFAFLFRRNDALYSDIHSFLGQINEDFDKPLIFKSHLYTIYIHKTTFKSSSKSSNVCCYHIA